MSKSPYNRNFITKRLVDQCRIATLRKKIAGYELIAVNGSSLTNVEIETILLPIAI